MIIHTAHLVCRPDRTEAFHSRLRKHAHTTLERESGCQCFDIHQNDDNPNLFFLYEIYADETALKAHQASDHFSEFRADTADWVTKRTWWFWKKVEPLP